MLKGNNGATLFALLLIKWTDKISYEEVLRQMNMEDMFLYNSIKKQKLSFAS